MEGNGLRARNRQAAMEQVQLVAVDLMRSAGFDAVTVEQVAEAAGVSASTVYRYFGTKEALVLWGSRADRLVDEIAGAAPGMSASDAFVAAADAIYASVNGGLLDRLDLIYANVELTVAFEHELLTLRDGVAAEFALARGSKSAGVRDDAAAGAYLGMLVAILHRWQRSGGSKSLPKMLAKAHTSLTTP